MSSRSRRNLRCVCFKSSCCQLQGGTFPFPSSTLHSILGSSSDLSVVTSSCRGTVKSSQSSKGWQTFLLEGGANNAVILTFSSEFMEKYSGETARKTSGFEFKERTREQLQKIGSP